MAKVRLLIVDDDEGILDVCAHTLHSLSDAELVLENRSPEALERLSKEHFDLLITDLRMPGVDGMELLRVARQNDPELPVLMLTGFPTVETAVESIKLGAADYIVKPFLPDDLVVTVRRLLRERRLQEENRLLLRQVERAYSFDEIVGRSPAMRAVLDAIVRIADANLDVLIVGETGTGKELVARSIHKRSSRRQGRFIPIDCGAIPEHLAESEFFGHERGAFTGAYAQRLGLMELADGGTFFLDEIGSMSLPLQAKLLRVLQERSFRRVGGKQELAVDIRVVAASSRDLTTEIAAQRFREDLFYRLNVGCIVLPPLRDRVEDIPLLVSYFVDRYGQEMGRPGVELTSEVIEMLNAYAWPGNVRELQNVIRRALVMSRNQILTPDDLPDELVARKAARPAKPQGGFFQLREQRLIAFEREYLTALMRSWQGDVAGAARAARLPRGTLYRLLKKHDLTAGNFRSET
jgi:DNA-binding NtrC family response regulator